MIFTRNEIVANPDFQDALPFIRHGARSLQSSNTFYDVWPGPTGERPFPSAAQTLTISSGSAANTGAGTGAQVARLLVVNDLFEATEIDVTLQGTTPVDLGAWRDVVSARVIRAGTFGSVEGGAVEVVHAGDGVLAHIAPGRNHDGGCHFVQPAGTVAQALRWRCHIDVPNQNDVAHGLLQVGMPGEPWQGIDEFVMNQDEPIAKATIGIGATLPAGTRYRARGECSRAGAEVHARVQMVVSEPPRAPRITL